MDNKNSLWDRFNNDKKFNAKVQLSFYVVFIVIVVIYINISNMGRNYNYNSTNNSHINNSSYISSNLLDTISNNYNYSVELNYKVMNDNNSVLEYNYVYSGKSYLDNLVINRKYNNTNNTFYKVSDEYYLYDNNNYKYIDSSLVYGDISYKYIELDGVKKLIKKASLDHVTNSNDSSYIYNLYVRDIVQSYKGDDFVSINVNISEEVLTIDVDYSNLYKQINNKITSCVIKYVYTDIDKILKFDIMNDER